MNGPEVFAICVGVGIFGFGVGVFVMGFWTWGNSTHGPPRPRPTPKPRPGYFDPTKPDQTFAESLQREAAEDNPSFYDPS